jgi:hypothetical protein
VKSPAQDDQLGLSAIAVTHAIGSRDEPGKLSCRVVCRDPHGPMPEQVLAILEAHACRPQAAAERMLQVVDPDLREAGPVPGANPAGSEHDVSVDPRR